MIFKLDFDLKLLLHFTALILEEIAIDCHNKETEERLLQEAHDLHLSSLQLAKKAFGEFNVQTAKHYGNLGRLYQSMRKFKVCVCVCKVYEESLLQTILILTSFYLLNQWFSHQRASLSNTRFHSINTDLTEQGKKRQTECLRT